MIKSENSPFKHIDPRALYFEPFYQLMRQTLLGWKLSENADHGCTSYRHIHVIPERNVEFHNNVTSPSLSGTNVSEAWRSVLKKPDLYISITPERHTTSVPPELYQASAGNWAGIEVPRSILGSALLVRWTVRVR